MTDEVPFEDQRCTIADDPVQPRGWTLLAHLVPADVAVVPQHPGLGASGDWFLTQGRDNATGDNATDDLVLTRFAPDGRRRGTLTISRGGHGDRMVMRGDDVGTYVAGVWCWLPWRTGTMTVAEALTHRGTRTRCPLAAHDDCQGEVDLGAGTWLRLYGGSIKGGRERDWTHKTATLEVIRGSKVVRTLDLDELARDDHGLPIGGRYEPEGLAQAVVDGEPWILAGFAVGRLGNTTLNVYGRPTRLV